VRLLSALGNVYTSICVSLPAAPSDEGTRALVMAQMTCTLDFILRIPVTGARTNLMARMMTGEAPESPGGGPAAGTIWGFPLPTRLSARTAVLAVHDAGVLKTRDALLRYIDAAQHVQDAQFCTLRPGGALFAQHSDVQFMAALLRLRQGSAQDDAPLWQEDCHAMSTLELPEGRTAQGWMRLAAWTITDDYDFGERVCYEYPHIRALVAYMALAMESSQANNGFSVCGSPASVCANLHACVLPRACSLLCMVGWEACLMHHPCVCGIPQRNSLYAVGSAYPTWSFGKPNEELTSVATEVHEPDEFVAPVPATRIAHMLRITGKAVRQ